jgi:hypothetical protein
MKIPYNANREYGNFITEHYQISELEKFVPR